MSKTTSTGIKFYIAETLPTAEDKAGYEALTWIEVGEVVDLPAYGPTVTVVESNPLATGITEKYPGFTNMGSLAVGLEQDLEDAGQESLQSSVQIAGISKPRSFKTEFTNDKVDYYKGGVFSYTTAVGSANSMVGSTANIEINSVVLREDAPTP